MNVLGSALEALVPSQVCLMPESGTQPALAEAATEGITIERVLDHITSAESALREAGVPVGSAVVVVFPAGIELSIAMLTMLASSYTCVPIDARLSATEQAFVMDDTDARAVVTATDAPDSVRRLARERGLAVVELCADDDPGSAWVVRAHWSSTGEATPATGLFLHTSGTTARAKLVGLGTHQLVASATNVARTLALGADDRGFLVMPLFHIHGIVAGMLAPVLAGGTVVVSGAFDAFSFERRAAQAEVTWSTAVPSIHRAVVRVARSREHALPSLRFLRSSSSPLDERLAFAVAEHFQCPLLNSYGMSEATHQMSSQQLDGWTSGQIDVGRPDGSDLALLVDGRVVRTGEVQGEVLVRGPHVIDRYTSPVEANATAFVDGWLRTGDLGRFSIDGKLTLDGRIKEMINVAGEKVSPFEVEAALRPYPGLTDVAAFAVPDDARGERVHVVVTVDEHCDIDGLRRFGRARLSAHKVPSGISVVPSIPLGPTGKVQRSRLAEQLGVAGPRGR